MVRSLHFFLHFCLGKMVVLANSRVLGLIRQIAFLSDNVSGSKFFCGFVKYLSILFSALRLELFHYCDTGEREPIFQEFLNF